MSPLQHPLFTGGQFKANREDSFPWRERGREVWYAVFYAVGDVVAAEGFLATLEGKTALVKYLKSLERPGSVTLMGVWTGAHYTSLFLLDVEISIGKLEEALGSK